ncbi:MAG TPA: hypothetical protein VMI06_08350 [Terriglobia bacterium]|nr:hypothetical protein [Terriglobia bacterium]
MSARLELALDLLTPTSWRRFEIFASEFLVSEFPGLVDTSAPSGDGGRDAEVFSPGGDPTVFLQYSCTADWTGKIRATAKRLSETHPEAQILVYASPRRIGADADSLKLEIRKVHRLHLEIRDKFYFTTREYVSRSTEAASETLAKEIVDPYLAARNVVASRASALKSYETRAAHTFLMLQLKDDTGEKGLTKLSFEAVIRSILAKTDAEHRVRRADLISAAKQVLSGHSTARVEELTTTALARLVKRQIVRVYSKDDTVCLSFEESKRVREHLALCELEEESLEQEIKGTARTTLFEEQASEQHVEQVSIRVRRVLEKCLYARAETFASAVLNERVSGIALDHLSKIIIDDLASFPPKKGDCEGNPDVLAECVVSILNNTSAPVYQHLKGLADAYTLMAFLSMTPDVQDAMQRIFSHGEIWLDTTIILPMLAESLLDDTPGRIQQILAMTSQAGIELYTTTGVLEELASHLKRALACDRIPASRWEGRIPFIFEAYVRSGKDLSEFAGWVEMFMGDIRPIEDLSAYIEEQFGIKTQDLAEEVDSADLGLRGTLDSIWQEWHERRRARNSHLQGSRELDPLTVLRLAKHDTESYLGVIQRRRTEAASPLGYKCWWLTFDSFALRIEEELRRHGLVPPSSPVLSIDFLSQYLSLGPVRGKVPKQVIQQLPLAVMPRLVAFLTPELLDEAKQIRLSLAGLPERVIARRVRDHLDAQRRKRGPLSQRGTDTVFDEIDDLELQS